MGDSLLGYNDALQFLKKINAADTDLMGADPLSFIQILVRQFMEHVPFQCVSILAQTKEEKHVPTVEEIVEASLSLEGGVCYTLNTFMCILLRVLNFKADVLDGCYSAFGDNHNHVVVLLSDLRFKDDSYIIDVGNGFAFEDPLPVSELPCTRYHSGLEYRYEWNGDVITRLHRKGDDDDVPEGKKIVSRGDWRQVFHFNLKPVTFDFFIPYMEEIYMDDQTCDYHFILRAIRFPPSEKAGKDDERIMLAFKNQSLLVGPMDNAQKTKVSEEEWAGKVKENFPTIPPAKVDLAVKNLFRIFQERAKQ